jgi:WD40 repeat protein
LWRVHDQGAERIELGSHDGPVRAVWAQDDRAASGGKDQRVRVWDLGEPQLMDGKRGVPAGPVSALCVCPEGWVVSGGPDKKLWLWGPGQVPEPSELGGHDSPVIAVTALPGTLVVSCSADGRIHVWDRSAPGELVNVPGTHEGAVPLLSMTK